MREMILAWREPERRKWIPVGKLWMDAEGKYRFAYTVGAQRAQNESKFTPFGQMNKLDKVYVSDELFPIFKNRLLQKSRPEYPEYLEWLGFDQTKELSVFDELSRTNGIRATDSLQLFEVPKAVDGRYRVYFFSHGISHLPDRYIERVDRLAIGERLFIMKDIQNGIDHDALVLRTEDPVEIVGYCPRFYVKDFNKLLEANGAAKVQVSVERVNLSSPLQLRLLCKLETVWPEGFKPFDHKEFDTVNGMGGNGNAQRLALPLN